MTNENKIIEMLTKMQADIDTLTSKANSQNENETPEEKNLRQLKAFRSFVNSTTDAEEPEATAKFFKFMDAEEARKAAF
ncbi:MAG: hypothetical protein IJT73_02740 [Selenomonadaceae bacterium]|nr:hypothetical protein [Selenomonadaceae bacterium]